MLITVANMIYRFLGKTGIQVSVIGFGNMVTDKVTAADEERCYDIMVKYHNSQI